MDGAAPAVGSASTRIPHSLDNIEYLIKHLVLKRLVPRSREWTQRFFLCFFRLSGSLTGSLRSFWHPSMLRVFLLICAVTVHLEPREIDLDALVSAVRRESSDESFVNVRRRLAAHRARGRVGVRTSRREDVHDDDNDEILREVLAENPARSRGVRDQWVDGSGIHRRVDIRRASAAKYIARSGAGKEEPFDADALVAEVRAENPAKRRGVRDQWRSRSGIGRRERIRT